MIYQICPICDQKLTRSHYCSNCRKRIRKPWTIDVDYYLNERHPDFAHDCTFHDYPSAADSRTSSGSQTQSGNYTPSGSYQSAGGNPGTPPARPVTIPNVPRQAQRAGRAAGQSSSRSHRNWIVMLVALIVVFSFIIFNIILNVARTSFIPDASEYNDFAVVFGGKDDSAAESGYDSNFGDTMLTDQEVIDGGLPCTAFGHFSVTVDDLNEELIPFIEELGYKNTDTYGYSYNTREDDGYSYFNSSTTNTFESIESADSFLWQDLSIDWDTAVRTVHSISVSWHDEEQAAEIFKKAAAILCGSGDWPMDQDAFSLWIDEAMDDARDPNAEIASPEALSELGIYVNVSYDKDTGYYISIDNWGE